MNQHVEQNHSDDDGAHATPVSSPPEAALAGGAGRSPVRVFIALAVAAQLLVPLTYYLRDDPYDERFAWRMFSGVRLQVCDVSASEVRSGEAREVNLYGAISPGWVANLQRNRRGVIDHYLEHRCSVEGVTSVRLVNRCRDVDGSALPPLEYRHDCAAGSP